MESYGDLGGQERTPRRNIVPTVVEALVELYADTLFCAADYLKDWFKWNGKHWEPFEGALAR